MKVAATCLVLLASVAGPSALKAQQRLNKVDSWVTVADYPVAAKKRGIQGFILATFEVSEEGKVENCKVERGRENRHLAQATCALITERARYIPAGDKSGKPARSKDQVMVRWALPTEGTSAGLIDFGGAIPIVSPTKWVTDNDIPRDEPNLRHPVVIEIRWVISVAGEVQNCTAVDEAGHPRLAELSCKLITKRAKFQMPVDEHGNPFETSAHSRVIWQRPS